MIEPTKFLDHAGIKDCYFSETPFTKKENRRKEYKPGDKVRSFTLSELKAEIDIQEDLVNEENKKKAFEIQERNFQKLKNLGHNVFLFSHDGKSPYNSLYGYDFKNRIEQREYFKAFAQKYLEVLPKGFKYDLSFYDDFHWCPLEYAEHYKYPGHFHKAVDFANSEKKNQIEPELLPKELPKQETRKVSLGYWDILKKTDATEQERVSAVISIYNKHPTWDKQAVLDFVIKHNAWSDFNAEKTAEKIMLTLNKYGDSRQIKTTEKKIGTGLDFLSFRDLYTTPKEKGFVIQHMIQPNTVNQIYSPPACFKSLLALHIALCVANGKDFLGFKTKKCRVAYLDKENNRQIIMERTKGLFAGMGLKRKNIPLFFLLREGLLDDEAFLEQLVNYVKENKIGLIVFDTLVRFNSGEENSAKDMNKLYQAFVKLQEGTKTAILFLHHTNRNGEFRGSSDLLGQVDTQFFVERKQKSTKFVLKNTKNRLGEINDINAEVLFGEDRINIIQNEAEAEQEQEEKVNKFSIARAFVCDYVKTNCSNALADTFRKAELITTLKAWNTDSKNKISSRLVEDVLQHLVKIHILGKGEKLGVYVFKDKQNPKIDSWINPIGQGGSLNA